MLDDSRPGPRGIPGWADLHRVERGQPQPAQPSSPASSVHFWTLPKQSKEAAGAGQRPPGPGFKKL